MESKDSLRVKYADVAIERDLAVDLLRRVLREDGLRPSTEREVRLYLESLEAKRHENKEVT